MELAVTNAYQNLQNQGDDKTRPISGAISESPGFSLARQLETRLPNLQVRGSIIALKISLFTEVVHYKLKMAYGTK